MRVCQLFAILSWLVTCLPLAFSKECNLVEKTKFKNVISQQYWSMDMSCEMDPKSCFIFWYFNKELFKPNPNKNHRGLAILTVKNVQPEDAGIYECRSQRNIVWRRFNLTVIDPSPTTTILFQSTIPSNPNDVASEKLYWLPIMMRNPASVISTMGDTESFKCSYFYRHKAEQKPKVRWFFLADSFANRNSTLGVEINNILNKYFIYSGEKKHCRHRNPAYCCESKLFISDIRTGDQGKFTCTIEADWTQSSSSLSHSFTMTVQTSALIGHKIRQKKEDFDDSSRSEKIVADNFFSVDFNKNTTICIGHSFKMECSGKPTEDIRVQIFRRNLTTTSGLTKLAESLSLPGLKISAGDGVKGTFEKLSSRVFYNIKMASLEDSGLYFCVGRNRRDHEIPSKEMYLTVANCSGTIFNSQMKPTFNWHVPLIVGIVSAAILVFFMTLLVYRCCRSHYDLNRPIKRQVVIIRPSELYHSVHQSGGSSLPNGRDSLLSDCSSAPLVPPDVKIRHTSTFRSRSASTSGVVSSSYGVYYEIPIDQAWEYPRDKVRLREKLGEGAFGVVHRADVEDFRGRNGVTTVAVKMLREDFTDQDLTDLVREMEMMKMLGPHDHITRLYGSCTQNGPLLVLVEYAPYGNLRDFLRDRRPGMSVSDRSRLHHPNISVKDMLNFASSVAKGMEYLASRSIIHRDLAARNILVGENLVVKIADFGLTRAITDYYKKRSDGRLPVKWMAPEALFDNKYTTKSDVWSFGILMWEIFSLGGTPYPSVPLERLFEVLRTGYRNERPAYSSMDIYRLMRSCWYDSPSSRPTFQMLSAELERITSQVILIGQDYVDVTEEYVHLLPTPSNSMSDSVPPRHHYGNIITHSSWCSNV